MGGVLCSVVDTIGTRNGLFYAPAYITLGLWFSEKEFMERDKKKIQTGLFYSFVLLITESIVAVMILKSKSTVLWLSVFPASFYLLQFVYISEIKLAKLLSKFIRKLSTLLYVSHGLFLVAFSNFDYGIKKFVIVLFCSVLFGIVVIFYLTN